MSHIVFVTPYYPPEITPPAMRISETAARLVKLGHRVTVLTNFPNFPTGVVPPEYRGHSFMREVRDGVQIVRVWSYLSPNTGFFRRILSQLSFGCISPLLGSKAIGRPDVIIVESPPLFDAIAARLLSWLKCCPFIFLVSDPWPEAAIQLGMLRNRLLIWLSERLEWSTYQKAAFVWVVSEKVRDFLIRRGFPAERIFLVTNGVDTAKFRPLPRSQARAELGWDDRFTVVYAGNHGLVYSLVTLLDAAAQLKGYPDIHLIFIGEGARKAELVAEAEKRGLKNVTFLDPIVHDRMPLVLAAADVHVIPLRNIQLNETTLPVKMFEMMACGRPFILGAEGLVRRVAVQEAKAAIYVEPENAAAMVSAILYLREHPDLAEAMGQRGLLFVKERFDRDQLTKDLNERIALLSGHRIPTSRVTIPAPAEKS